MASEKYRAFRQFMVNELGITRDDIEQWTKEAVEAEVRRIIGQMDAESRVAVLATRQLVNDNNLRRLIVLEVARQFEVSVKPVEEGAVDA